MEAVPFGLIPVSRGRLVSRLAIGGKKKEAGFLGQPLFCGIGSILVAMKS